MIVARLPKPIGVAAKMVSSASVGIARDTLDTTTVTPPPRPVCPSARAVGTDTAAAMSTAKKEM